MYENLSFTDIRTTNWCPLPTDHWPLMTSCTGILQHPLCEDRPSTLHVLQPDVTQNTPLSYLPLDVISIIPLPISSSMSYPRPPLDTKHTVNTLWTHTVNTYLIGDRLPVDHLYGVVISRHCGISFDGRCCGVFRFHRFLLASTTLRTNSTHTPRSTTDTRTVHIWIRWK